MKVNIEKLDSFGRGVTHIDGKVCFVDGALPEEVVEIEIVKDNKNYSEAIIKKIINKTSNRVRNDCKYYPLCGGCQLRHLNYQDEANFKTNLVKELISRIGSIDPNIVEECISLDEYNYRNKITFHVKDGILGLYSSKSNDIVDIDKCLLVDDRINKIIPTLKEMARKNDVSEVMVRITSNDSIMVNFIGNLKYNGELNGLVDALYINNKLVKGKQLITDIRYARYYVSPNSFFQVNNEIVDEILLELKSIIKEISPKSVLDLYCGTGSIGIYVAPLVNEVLGIDYSVSGINDANLNKKLNKLTNIEFVCSRVEDYIDKLKNKYDLVIVDPPRGGLDSKTINYLKEMSPASIVYISCNPATLSRDLKELNSDYEVKHIKPYNMFPRTYHVECVTILCRKAL